MSGSWFTENFNDFSDEFFDELDGIKYCEYPLEDIEASDEEDWEAKFQNLEPPPLNVLTSFSLGNGFENGKNDSKIKDSLIFCDNPNGLSVNNSDETSQTCSPVSVLDSTSTSTSSTTENLVHCFITAFPSIKRPRSKRSTRRRPSPPLLITAAGETVCASKGITFVSSEVKIESLEPGDQRRCTHCNVAKTPQWREGPMGPKTLCNACGVRYRSGRLFPEYRPAASPTFIPSVHSNSHRKVLEMRKKSQIPS